VERKLEIRFQPNQPVRLTDLSGPRQTLMARIINLNGRIAELQIPDRIAAGSAIRIDLDDSMLMGEVTLCAAQGDQFAIQLAISEAIPCMSDLQRLVSALMCEGRNEVTERRAPRATTVK
jgi:hypothetical protein